MRQFSAAQSVAAIFAVLTVSLLVSCSGTTSTNPVTSITLTPLYLSLSPGQTFQLGAQPKDYAGNNVVADVSYASSNTNLVTVTATGIVCAGLWDPNFITCNAIKGQAAVGQANITVTSGSVTATAATYTHLQVDRIFVTPPTGCVSMGATPTYLATVYNITAPGCSPNIPCDITSSVGPITFNSTDTQVMSNNVNSGVLTATAPGATSIFASVSGLNSVPQPALVCPVQSILIHDAASSNTVFSLAPTNTQNLIADVLDTSGASIAPVLTWSPVPAGVGTTAATTSSTSTAPPPNSETFTANTGGTSIVTATCAPPTCNRSVPPQYGQNIVTVNVSGGTTTTVYAGSTNSLMLVPIQTSNNSTGTTITLPYLPNSIVSDSAGNNVYLGSGSGIMTVNVTSGAVTVSTAAVGTILAISADGNYLLVSNSATTTTYLFSTSGSSAALAHDVT
ncbi:MAG TPA: Ig-like domain-containing protein, partial [Terriglobales bacterium]